jgi:hypothetical protein
MPPAYRLRSISLSDFFLRFALPSQVNCCKGVYFSRAGRCKSMFLFEVVGF